MNSFCSKLSFFISELTIQLQDSGIYLYTNIREELTAQQAIAWCKNKGYKHVKQLSTGIVTQYITQQAFKGNIRSDVGGFWTGQLQSLLDPVTETMKKICKKNCLRLGKSEFSGFYRFLLVFT